MKKIKRLQWFLERERERESIAGVTAQFTYSSGATEFNCGPYKTYKKKTGKKKDRNEKE